MVHVYNEQLKASTLHTCTLSDIGDSGWSTENIRKPVCLLGKTDGTLRKDKQHKKSV